ncbi:MAG: HsmA family protein [Anaerofustis sp.]
MLPYAIIAITSALVFYTIGVWSEKIQKELKPWHLVVFWTGLLFDTIGTTLMGKIAGSAFQLNLHGITGSLAIALMLFHAIWASVVLIKNNEKARANFHKFSLIVWIVWLIPYLSGLAAGMMH